jgi:hypothetical protein
MALPKISSYFQSAEDIGFYGSANLLAIAAYQLHHAGFRKWKISREISDKFALEIGLLVYAGTKSFFLLWQYNADNAFQRVWFFVR